MNASVVLTVIAEDRPGLVELLSQTVIRQDGNWLESRMARLAGKFAGVALVEVPDDKVDALLTDLNALADRGLRIRAERTDVGDGNAESLRRLDLDLVGHDRPGIVRAVSEALARSHVNVDRLTTERSSAPMSGERLFRATAQLRLPDDLDLTTLRQQLEAIASDLVVDLTLLEPTS
ncbi:MAG: glycine cleavage system protein R [Candidatus Eisenbacteria bacterium]|uniref:Glycine cleavage system protein R n=1 Tax=Eiseniibacteriota bacterium TaxID=2212470 RepID=A0A956RQR1_UNCEI|nr:glycine cleavage system protein R [Candidatus Eisenbacteria bacterium]